VIRDGDIFLPGVLEDNGYLFGIFFIVLMNEMSKGRHIYF